MNRLLESLAAEWEARLVVRGCCQELLSGAVGQERSVAAKGKPLTSPWNEDKILLSFPKLLAGIELIECLTESVRDRT